MNSLLFSRLTSDLERDEALRFFVYDCGTGLPLKKGDTIKGHPTIGIGRNLEGRGITKEEAHYLLKNDIDYFDRYLIRMFPGWYPFASDNRKRAMLNMIFSMGEIRFLTFRKMLAALNKGRWQEAADELVDSRFYRTHTERAKRIESLMREG